MAQKLAHFLVDASGDSLSRGAAIVTFTIQVNLTLQSWKLIFWDSLVDFLTMPNMVCLTSVWVLRTPNTGPNRDDESFVKYILEVHF